MTPILQTEKLTHVYSEGTPFEKTAIENVDFEVYRGEFIAVIGHTGSGKSTFIQHLNGLMKPTSGYVCFDGEDINSSKEKTKMVRQKVGLVFQYPEYQLFEDTVALDIAFGPKNMGLSKEEIDERVLEAADFVGLSKEELERSPFELSGGQKRRAAIAGVIAMRPEVLILDEPMAGHDPAGCEEISSNIRKFHEKTGAAVIMVTHDMEAAAKNASRLFVMDKGRAAMSGTPEEVFSRGRELCAMGLELPMVTRVMTKLRSLGVPVSTSAYTARQAAAEILSLCAEGRGGKDA